MLAEFSRKLVYSTMCGKNLQICGVCLPRKCIESMHFYSPPSPLKTLQRNQRTLTQRKITHSPRQYFFENLFSPTPESRDGNYDLLYQTSIRKDEDELEY